MRKFRKKLSNPTTGYDVYVDADLATCEYCGETATSVKPIADQYGQYDTDVLTCDDHNPYVGKPITTASPVEQMAWSAWVHAEEAKSQNVTDEEVRQGIAAMERGEVA